jgi:hypothetical protein
MYDNPFGRMILYEHYNEKQRYERADTPVSRRRTDELETDATRVEDNLNRLRPLGPDG